MQKISLTSGLTLTASGKQRRFKIVAYNGGKITVGGFKHPVVVDLQGMSVPPSIPILLDHQASVETTLGATDGIENDGRTLVLSGPVTATSQRAKQVVEQHDSGHRWQASIGANVEQAVEIAAGQTVRVNHQTFTGPIIVARVSQLKETSVLPMGADSTTSVNLAAKAVTLNEGTNMTFEDFANDLGIDTANLTASGTALLQQQYESVREKSPDELKASMLTDLRATAAADLRRQSEIQSICIGFPHIAATAIEQGWSKELTENHVLKAQAMQRNGRVSSFRGGTSQTLDQNALTASLMIRAGAEDVALKAFGEQTCEVARAARITNMVDLAAAALQLNGLDSRAYESTDKMLKAAFSTVTLPNILSDSMSKTLDDAYEETTSDWRKFCFIGNAKKLSTNQTSIRPNSIANLEQLGAGGKMKHGSLGEEDTYNWQVDTYAKMLQITRRDIINDDLNFLDELAPQMGTAAGRTLLDLIWSTILGGQTAGFFASGNSNLGEAGSALDVDALGAGITAMRKQRDSKGVDLNIAPAVLVIGPTLEPTARPILNSTEILSYTTTAVPSGNPMAGIVPNLVVEPRLENSTRFSNTSTTQWFLFGGPRTKPVTVGFLNGQQNPTVEVEDAPFDTLGMQMRIYHDFGCALSDEKAAYKATGAS